MIHWLQQFIDKWNAGRRAKKPNGTLMDEVEDVSANPWIYATREVIEQILLYRGRISGHRVDCESDICKKTGEEMLESKAAERHDLLEAYREFRPMILDTDSDFRTAVSWTEFSGNLYRPSPIFCGICGQDGARMRADRPYIAAG